MGTPTSQGPLLEIARALSTYVEYQRELGVLGWARDAAPSAPVAVEPPRAVAPPPAPVRVESGPADLFASPGLSRTDIACRARTAIGLFNHA